MDRHARITIDCDNPAPQSTAVYLRTYRSGGLSASSSNECAFIETNTSHVVPKLLATLEAERLDPNDVRWVVVTHAHLDHAAGASALLRACPRATLLAHPRAARHLIDPAKLIASATSVYGEALFSQLYGTIEPIPAERVRVLSDGETFELGDRTLQVFHTAGHANHHFVVHDPAIDTVFTGDTFGIVYPRLQRGERFAFPSTSPTNFDPDEARKSLARVLGLGARSACLTHFGEVTDLVEVASQLRVWLDRAESWLNQETASGDSAAVMTERLRHVWRAAMVEAADAANLAFDDDARALLAVDIELNAQGVAVVAESRRKTRAEASPR